MDERVGIYSILFCIILSAAVVAGYGVGIIHEDGDTYSGILGTSDEKTVESVDGYGYYKDGDSVTLNAHMKEGFFFTGWYDKDGKLVSTDNPYTFVSEKDVYLHPEATKGGSVKTYAMDGITSIYYVDSSGMNIEITVVVGDGYNFLGWYNIEKQCMETLAGTGNLTVDYRMCDRYAAITDSDKYSGDCQLIESTNNSNYASLRWVVTDAATGNYVASAYGTNTIDVNVAPGTYNVRLAGFGVNEVHTVTVSA